MAEKSRQKFKYLENEKRFQDEIKSNFHHFQRVFIEEIKTIFFWKCESATLSLQAKNIKKIFANLNDKQTQIQLDKIILIHVMK